MTGVDTVGFDFVRVHLNERTEIPMRYWTVIALEKVVDHGVWSLRPPFGRMAGCRPCLAEGALGWELAEAPCLGPGTEFDHLRTGGAAGCPGSGVEGVA